MKKILYLFIALFMSITMYAETYETPVDSAINLSEVTVSGLYRNSINVGYLIDNKTLISENYGQEPSHLFASMPNIFSMNDNGTNFGYGYFRIRGLDQTRINVTLDGMPWNESEDYGRKGENFEESVQVLKDYVKLRFASLGKLIDKAVSNAK